MLGLDFSVLQHPFCGLESPMNASAVSFARESHVRTGCAFAARVTRWETLHAQNCRGQIEHGAEGPPPARVTAAPQSRVRGQVDEGHGSGPLGSRARTRDTVNLVNFRLDFTRSERHAVPAARQPGITPCGCQMSSPATGNIGTFGPAATLATFPNIRAAVPCPAAGAHPHARSETSPKHPFHETGTAIA